MHAERFEIALTTDGDGAAVGYTARRVTGRILALLYRKTDFADGVDFAVTTETTEQNLWTEENVNASKDVYPARAVQGADGVDLEDVYASPVAVDERIKVVVADGGAAKTGTVQVIIG